ncbi:2799_t:CDS:2 [Entrophospora sp. SA101]|nr:2799_t:CDS:2 [Entrophospora sp. SA101]CAJ0842612.1 276_t:CDS:2 [Entrophospora sp. SA101]
MNNLDELFSHTKNIYGRTFLSDQDVKYLLPVDDLEINRNITFYLLWKCVWQNDFSVPIEEKLQNGCSVLDIGCGPGYWLIDMAEKYPKSTFLGIDVANCFYSGIIGESSSSSLSSSKPENLGFLQCNVIKGIPFPDNTFDFIRQYEMCMSFAENDWKYMINEFVRVLKPSGWIEISEFGYDLLLGGKTEAEKGLNGDIYKDMPKLLESNPNLVDHRTTSIKCPVGSWAGNLGGLMCEQLHQMIEAMVDVPACMEITKEEYRQKLTEYIHDINKFGGYMTKFRFYCQKNPPNIKHRATF